MSKMWHSTYKVSVPLMTLWRYANMFIIIVIIIILPQVVKIPGVKKKKAVVVIIFCFFFTPGSIDPQG